VEVALGRFAKYKFATAGIPVEIEVCRVASSNSGSVVRESNQPLASSLVRAKPYA